MVNYCELSKPKKVWMGDERYIYAVDVGQVKIVMHQKAIYLVQNIYYIPDLNNNLLSCQAQFTPGWKSAEWTQR